MPLTGIKAKKERVSTETRKYEDFNDRSDSDPVDTDLWTLTETGTGTNTEEYNDDVDGGANGDAWGRCIKLYSQRDTSNGTHTVTCDTKNIMIGKQLMVRAFIHGIGSRDGGSTATPTGSIWIGNATDGWTKVCELTSVLGAQNGGTVIKGNMVAFVTRLKDGTYEVMGGAGITTNTNLAGTPAFCLSRSTVTKANGLGIRFLVSSTLSSPLSANTTGWFDIVYYA